MSSTNNPLLSNCQQKLQVALSENKPVVEDNATNFDVDTGRSVDIEIINGVRDRPHLYDPSRFGYRNVEKRDYSFAAIGSQLNMTGEEVAKRWKALRDRYAREKRLTEASRKWKLFSQLMFLNEHVKSRRTSDWIESLNNPSDMETPSGNCANDCDDAHSMTFEQPSDDENSSFETSDCSSPSVHDSGPPPKRQRRSSSDEIVDVMRNITQTMKNSLYQQAKPAEPMDECVAYGISVARTLMRLTPRQRSLARVRIHQALYDVEFGE